MRLFLTIKVAQTGNMALQCMVKLVKDKLGAGIIVDYSRNYTVVNFQFFLFIPNSHLQVQLV